MTGSSRVLGIAGIIVAILAIGAMVGLLATRKSTSSEQASGPEASSFGPASSNRAPYFPANPGSRPGAPSTNQIASPSSVTGTNLITDWADKLDDILGSDGEESDKAKKLLAMFPHLPQDGQVEIAQHLSNLTADQDYAPLGKLLKDSSLAEQVLDILIVDVLNRPNSLKLPALLEVARDPQHPKAGEAKDLMELYLEEDYGTDWTKWQTKMEQWLKDNPD